MHLVDIWTHYCFQYVLLIAYSVLTLMNKKCKQNRFQGPYSNIWCGLFNLNLFIYSDINGSPICAKTKSTVESESQGFFFECVDKSNLCIKSKCAHIKTQNTPNKTSRKVRINALAHPKCGHSVSSVNMFFKSVL